MIGSMWFQGAAAVYRRRIIISDWIYLVICSKTLICVCYLSGDVYMYLSVGFELV